MTAKYTIIKPSSLVLLAFLGLTVGAGKTPAQTQNAQGPPTNETKIRLTAVDKDGRFVTTLRAEDLRLLQDGEPQKISSFQRITGRVLSLAILIDTSTSQEHTLPGQKIAAMYFVESIMRSDADEAAIATFTDVPTIEQKLTRDVTLLRQAIERAKVVLPPGYIGGGVVVGPLPPPTGNSAVLPGSTAIWDAVLAACDDVLSQSARQTRRAIIILSDGEDTGSKSKMAAAIDRAVRDDVAIYAIGIGDSNFSGINKDALRKLSERTGGRAFFPKKVDELAAIFSEIGQELRTQYLISFSSASRSGASAKIKIEMMNPDLRTSGLQLFYQQTVPNK
jgi:Ca-activated chloride channel family protein